MILSRKRSKPAKKNERSLFKRVNSWLHLWMGLISGLIVFVVGITGCFYVFEKDIRNLTQRYQFVAPQDIPFLPPTQLRQRQPGTLLASRPIPWAQNWPT